MQAINLTRNTILIERGKIATSAWARMRGLLGHPPLKPGEGLWLPGEKAIHSVGMTFPIDVLFLDQHRRVILCINAMPPMRFSPIVWRAQNVLELPSGRILETNTRLGDEIRLPAD